MKQAQRHREAADDLWKQLGLEELRGALEDVECLARRFEEALRGLPPCTACARVTLLQQIYTAGYQLGSKIVNLTVLASSLKQAVAAAEQAQAELVANVPVPCQCSTGPCTCHD